MKENQRSQITSVNRVPEEADEEFCKELDNWIKDEWLQPYNGEYDAVVPLTAVLLKNKSKVRPVMDNEKLNEYVRFLSIQTCGDIKL